MVLPSFKQYLAESQREAFFSFTRMNPPTVIHEKMMNVVSTKAGKNSYRVYLTQSCDSRQNPLTYEQKIKYARKMFPKHGRNIMMDENVKSVLDVATKLYDEGFNRITMITGSDRLAEHTTILEKYNGKEGRHGFYVFEKINVVSAGMRDPDSQSNVCKLISENNFTSFSQSIPPCMTNRDAKRLFNDVRVGMGLRETTSFKHHVELEPVSEIRERFVEGELFNEGDQVFIKSSGKSGYIHRLGANYVIVALDEGRISRQWIDNVERVEEKTDRWYKDQPEWGTPEATKKAKKKVPGQSIKEEVTQAQIRDLERFADRLLNKFDIDIEFTRHFADRVNDSRNKPAITVAELQRFFQKMADNKGKKIKKHGNAEAVLKDMQSDLNLPVVVNWRRGEFEVVNKTIMRKKGFKTSNPVVQYEDAVDDARDRIDQLKKQDKVKYDRILDRARMARARNKNKQTNPRL